MNETEQLKVSLPDETLRLLPDESIKPKSPSAKTDQVLPEAMDMTEHPIVLLSDETSKVPLSDETSKVIPDETPTASNIAKGSNKLLHDETQKLLTVATGDMPLDASVDTDLNDSPRQDTSETDDVTESTLELSVRQTGHTAETESMNDETLEYSKVDNVGTSLSPSPDGEPGKEQKLVMEMTMEQVIGEISYLEHSS